MAYLVQFLRDSKPTRFYNNLEDVDLELTDYWSWKNIKCAPYFSSKEDAEAFAEICNQAFKVKFEEDLGISTLKIYDGTVVGYGVNLRLPWIKVYELNDGQEIEEGKSLLYFSDEWQTRDVFVKAAKDLIKDYLKKDRNEKERFGYVAYTLLGD